MAAIASSVKEIFVLPSNNLSQRLENASVAISYNTSEMGQAFRIAVNVLNNYTVPIICLLGIVGNITSFFVFVCSSFRYQPCSQYLAALACVDTLFLLSHLLNCLITFFPDLALLPGCCAIMVYMSYVCSFLSVWFVVLMMLERCIVVCYPFRAPFTSNKKASIILISAFTVFSMILYCHSFFTTTVSNFGRRPCTSTQESFEFMTVFTFIDAIIAFVIPFLAILFLNLRVIFTVRKFRLRHNLLHLKIGSSQRYHNSNKTLSIAQVRSTKMLIWVSSVFVILYLPSYAVRLYGLVLAQVQGTNMSKEFSFWFHIAQQLCQILYFINFAIDFIVYSVTSSNFRRNVCRRLRKSCKCSCACSFQQEMY